MSEQTPPDPSEADLDIDLLMELHAMTPAERMARHDAALQLVQALREAGTNFYWVDPRTLAAPEPASTRRAADILERNARDSRRGD